MSDVTRILDALAAGESQAADQLLPLVYDELRRLAAANLAHEKPGQTLDATALVHEAYLRLVSPASPVASASGELGALTRPRSPEFANRRHFFAAAAEAMRRILVENARRKRRLKRGGGRERVELGAIPAPLPRDDLLALDEALALFAAEDPAKAELVKLRYFAGLSVEEAASCLGISRATADRWWSFARAWLYEKIQSKNE